MRFLYCRPLYAALVMMALVGMLNRSASAQFGDVPQPAKQSPADDPVAAEAKKAYEANLAKYKGNADMLVLPGLLADRKARQVRIWGKSTGVGYGDPVEFFAIPVDSGKDYEAISVVFTKPSDVHKALEFVGMKPGRPVNFAANQFWPKGERVFMTFEWIEPGQKAGDKPASQRARAEQLVVNVKTGKPLPATGLVFTGSFRIRPEDQPGKEMYAADVVDPRSIASNFNCRASVMDVPRQAIQGEVYGSQRLNSAFRFTPGQAVQIVLEPEHKDGKARVVDLSLRATMPAGKEDAPVQAAQFVLTDSHGKQLNEGPTLVHVLAACNKVIEAGQDPFVTIELDDAMTLAQARELYKLLMTMDSEDGIRIDAPPAGNLFCRAFFPREEWKDRKNRLGRPWELHLDANAPGQGTLILPADEIDDNRGMGDLTFKVESPEQLARVLAEKSDRFSQSVYIFAPPKMKYRQLMSLIRPAMKTHATMYIFPR